MEKIMFFVIPEMPSKTFVTLRRLGDNTGWTVTYRESVLHMLGEQETCA